MMVGYVGDIRTDSLSLWRSGSAGPADFLHRCPENCPKTIPYSGMNARSHGDNDKIVVTIESRNPLLCNMKRQRRNDILVEQVVERLKSIRRAQGLTQENVRFDTDLNIGRIESGRHSISLTTLADLCDYYGISLETFFKEIVTRK